MEKEKLQALFDAKLIETEPNRFLLANIQKKKFFEWFVHGFKAASDAKAPLTMEEKVAQAAFYVDEFGSTYKIDFHIAEERWFEVSSVEKDDTFIVHYDNIPANAYFLGTHRL